MMMMNVDFNNDVIFLKTDNHKEEEAVNNSSFSKISSLIVKV